jgi:transcriptional regulator with XRE-family HTH domain
MPGQERAVDRGARRAAVFVFELGRELRDARLAHGLSQAEVARAVGLSQPEVSRLERGLVPTASIVDIARLLSTVGLELSARAYPSGQPVRDAAHLRLLAALRACLHPGLSWRTEVPIPINRDLRAWDGLVTGPTFRIGVEAETRVRDIQALSRRIGLKQRDSNVDHVILLLAGTRWNRNLVRGHAADLAAQFPGTSRDVLAALLAGRDPGASCVILLQGSARSDRPAHMPPTAYAPRE